jgi:two-component system sensor histidine kinase PilS (NtrC family)
MSIVGASGRANSTAVQALPVPTGRTPSRRSGERARTEPRGSRFPTWGALRLLLLFRLVVVVVLVLVFSPAAGDPLVPRADSQLAWKTLVVYAILVLASGINLYSRWPSRDRQVQLAVFVDLAVFTLLMHAAGGVASGLGALIAMAVAVGALMMEGRLSLLFASLGTLAVIAEQTLLLLQGQSPASTYTQAGLLGVVFFAVALLSHVLYRRVRSVEELAARRKVDIDDLSKLNEFIIQTMATGVLVVDGDRLVRLMNQAARDLFDAPEAQPGTPLADISPTLAQWLADHVRFAAPPGEVLRIGEREVKPSLQFLGDFRASGVLLYLRDNQELAKEAQQIKLASLGTLTASIAHNIRNPLSAIAHAGQLLTETDGLSADDRHLLEIVRRNSGRIDEIVDSVLQLSRRNQADPRPTDLVAWLEELSGELRETHGLHDDRLRLELEPPPIAVEVDPRHLHQVLANLCENALLHAGSPDRPARVLVRAGLGQGSDKAWIEVRDDGPGIDDETAREMFAPFYTTKASGTGLGLYIARELCETNGIRLHYERIQPNGSCFRLIFSG